MSNPIHDTDVQIITANGAVSSNEIFELIITHLNGEYPVNGLSKERINLSQYSSLDWTEASVTQNASSFKVNLKTSDGLSSISATISAATASQETSYKNDSSFDVSMVIGAKSSAFAGDSFSIKSTTSDFSSWSLTDLSNQNKSSENIIVAYVSKKNNIDTRFQVRSATRFKDS